jgi:hypothetical protein
MVPTEFHQYGIPPEFFNFHTSVGMDIKFCGIPQNFKKENFDAIFHVWNSGLLYFSPVVNVCSIQFLFNFRLLAEIPILLPTSEELLYSGQFTFYDCITRKRKFYTETGILE